MQVLINDFVASADSPLSGSQRVLLFALSDRWDAIYRVSYAIEFMCLSTEKLIVLDRMSQFAAANLMTAQWVAARRIVMACVVAGDIGGLAGNVVLCITHD